MKFSKRITIKYLFSFSVLMVLMFATLFGFVFLSERKPKGYSNESEPAELLRTIADKTLISRDSITISQEMIHKIEQNNGWLQILNEEGKEIYNLHRPDGIQTSYAPGELVSYRKASNLSGYKIFTWYKQLNSQKLTWIYGTIYRNNPMNEYGIWIGVLMAFMVLIVLIAIVFGVQLGKPILLILYWIENISKGIYEEPINKSGTPFFHEKDTKELRKSYRTHGEMISAVESLSQNLKLNEEKRELLDKSREEWIAGVSHDMKTPLSSVKGYAKLLSSEAYEFTKAELSSYAGIIEEKAAYMEDLIEDLNLTFALNNHALPIQLKPVNVVELVRRSVIDLLNNESSRQYNIEFLNREEDKIIYPLDEKWFKRAIDNLLWNAINHNNPGTTLSIIIESGKTECVIQPIKLRLSDNGKGIEEKVLDHIFDRYYRGTNTSETQVKGSGLGTAIAKQLIEAQEGTITVESVLNKGTTFIIHLPGKN